MPGKHPETEKEQVTFKGQGEAEPPTDFVTLGMCIIGKSLRTPGFIIGPSPIWCAGIYAALGARIVRGKDVNGEKGCKSVGMIVHEGCDFPVGAKAELESWHLSSCIVETPQRLTTRGKNIYSKGGVRGK
ncbi:MAG: hypothetical protein Q9175_001476 [Cornicularia normoerica]